jgi:ketosteroid isomerase-like protein
MTDASILSSTAIVRRFYDTAGSGDVEACIATLHEDFEAEIPLCLPWAGLHRGRAAFRDNVLPHLSSILDLATLRVESLYGENDRAFATVTAVSLASGRTAIVGEDWRVTDQKLIALRVYYFDPGVLLPAHT